MNTTLGMFLDRKIWKTYGAVSTPIEIVDFMIRASGIEKWEGLKILEPGCGFCDFLARIENNYHNNDFTGLEVNAQVYGEIISLYPKFTIIQSDFLLWDTDEKYDVVIGNPPYGIIGDKKHYPIHILKDKKLMYRKASSTWFGKYNIYGAFIEKGLKLLKEGGKLVFIVPATFMILDDFKYLRTFMSIFGRTKVFYLGPKMFKNITVSTAVLVVCKGSSGIELYEVEGLKKTSLCYEKKDYDGGIIRFDSQSNGSFALGAYSLGDYFTFKFAARSPEIKRHPLVSREEKEGSVPVLTGRNLHSGWIDYNNCYSGLWMPREAAVSLRSFYSFPHIVIGHTKGGKLVAAVDKECYPWREDIHLVPKDEGFDLDAITLYLNSDEVQKYMNSLYKDITPHVTITQLRQVPVRVAIGESRRSTKFI